MLIASRVANTERPKKRILLLVDDTETRSQLTELLKTEYWLLTPNQPDSSEVPTDLVIVDRADLGGDGEWLQSRRRSIAPAVLPILLITPRGQLSARAPEVHRLVDAVITTPLDVFELQMRVRSLATMRELSMQLQLAEEAATTTANELTQGILPSVQALRETACAPTEQPPTAGAHRELPTLAAVCITAGQLHADLTSILSFLQLSANHLELRPIRIQVLLDQLLHSGLPSLLKSAQLALYTPSHSPLVLADIRIFTLVMKHLLAHVISSAPAAAAPVVAIAVMARNGQCRTEVRIELQDNASKGAPGARSDSARASTASSHRQTLDLAIARKGARLMGGSLGYKRLSAREAVFWIDLNCSHET